MAVVSAAVCLAIAASGVPTSNSAEISTRVLSMPRENTSGEMREAAQMIECAFDHAFDNIYSSMGKEEVLLAVTQALRPSGEFAGAYKVIICQAGVKEQAGAFVVDLKVMYELRDGDFAIERELCKSATLLNGRPGGAKNV